MTLCCVAGARASQSSAFSTTVAVSDAAPRSQAQGRCQQSLHSCTGQVRCLNADSSTKCGEFSVDWEAFENSHVLASLEDDFTRNKLRLKTFS